MKGISFTAVSVESDPCDSENLAHAFFRGGSTAQANYLGLARFTDDQDGGIELEVDEQTRRTVNQVRQCTLDRDRVSVVLTEKGALELGGVPSVTVAFTLSEDAFVSLHAALAAIFRDTKRLVPAPSEGAD